MAPNRIIRRERGLEVIASMAGQISLGEEILRLVLERVKDSVRTNFHSATAIWGIMV